MCVILAKPAGVNIPSSERFRSMFESNADGAGFMYSRNGKVHIRKGFMKLKKLMHAIEGEHITKADALVVHFRIATSGSVSPANTHPFPVSSELRDIRSLNTDADLGVAHNGVLTYPHDKKNDLSDTATFTREVLAHLKTLLKETPIQSLIEMAVGNNNRFVFLNKKGQFDFYGEWKTDDDAKDGCFYSNLYFKWRERTNTDSWKDSMTQVNVYDSKGDFDYTYWTSKPLFQEKDAQGRMHIPVGSVHESKVKKPKETPSDNGYQGALELGSESLISYQHSGDTKCQRCSYPVEASRTFCTKCGALLYNEDRWD